MTTATTTIAAETAALLETVVLPRASFFGSVPGGLDIGPSLIHAFAARDGHVGVRPVGAHLAAAHARVLKGKWNPKGAPRRRRWATADEIEILVAAGLVGIWEGVAVRLVG